MKTLDERHCVVAHAAPLHSDQIELGELLERARHAVLTARQDRILELWTDGHTVPEIAQEMKMPAHRVSDEKYKVLRKLERYLAATEDEENWRETA